MTTVRKGRRRVASTALNSDAGSANASSFMATSVASSRRGAHCRKRRSCLDRGLNDLPSSRRFDMTVQMVFRP